MAERMRRWSLPLLVTLILVGLATLLTAPPRGAQSAPFTVPTWVNNNPAPECRACGGCSCPGPAQFSPEGVHYPTGDLVIDQPLFDVSGVLGRTAFSLRFRSMIDGVSQFGLGWVPWYPTAKMEVLIPADPTDPGGHEVVVGYPDGTQHAFLWNGATYDDPDCGTDVLVPAGGDVILVDKYNDRWTINLGTQIPASFEDRNGNTDVYSVVSGTSINEAVRRVRESTRLR